MIFKLIRIFGFFLISHTMDYIGYGVTTKEYWFMLVTSFVLCLACALEEMV